MHQTIAGTHHGRPAGGRRNRTAAAAAALLLAGALLAPSAAADVAAGLPARLSRAAAAAEYWDLTFRAESGHSLFARFLVTNQGPGELTGVASGHVVFPDGRTHPFQFGLEWGRWSISEDRMQLKIGSAVLDLHGPERRLEIDSNKKGLAIELRFPARPASLVSGSDGLHVASVPLTEAVGTLGVRGMAPPTDVRGTLALKHGWAGRHEAEVAWRWLELSASDDGVGLHLWQMTPPAGGGGGLAWLSLVRGTNTLVETRALTLELSGTTGAEADRFPVPARIALRGDGVRGEIRVVREQVRTDPTDAIPQPFRWWIRRGMQPRRIWARAALTLEVATPAGETLVLDAPATLAVTLLNPLH